MESISSPLEFMEIRAGATIIARKTKARTTSWIIGDSFYAFRGSVSASEDKFLPMCSISKSHIGDVAMVR